MRPIPVTVPGANNPTIVPRGLVISIAALKGGAGKTTLSTNLAVCLQAAGNTTLLLDGDNASRAATKWGAIRRELMPADPLRALPIPSLGLETAMIGAAATHDVVIVDGPPNINVQLREQLAWADIALLPCGPSALDFWALDETVQEWAKASVAPHEPLPAAIVLTKLRPDTYGETIEARKAAKRYGLPVYEMKLRTSYPAAFNDGRGVTDGRHPRAAEELRALAAEILKTPQRKKDRTWETLSARAL